MNSSQQIIYISSDEEGERETACKKDNKRMITSTQQMDEAPEWENTTNSTIHIEREEWKWNMDASSENWSIIFKSSSKEEIMEPYNETHMGEPHNAIHMNLSENECEGGQERRYLNNQNNQNEQETIIRNTIGNSEGTIIRKTEALKEIMSMVPSSEVESVEDNTRKGNGKIHNLTHNGNRFFFNTQLKPIHF